MSYEPDRSIEGWLTPLECDLLYRLARQCTGRGSIVEIGSHKGKSTVCLAAGSRDGAGLIVHAIDPHTGSSLPDFRRNIADSGVQNLVKEHITTSAAAAAYLTGPVELLFIDGNHDLSAVQQDVELWLPRVIHGGVVAMHDSVHMEGPSRVSRSALFLSGKFKDVRFIHSTTFGMRTQQTTTWESLRNRCRLVMRDAYALLGRRLRPSLLTRALGDLVRRL